MTQPRDKDLLMNRRARAPARVVLRARVQAQAQGAEQVRSEGEGCDDNDVATETETDMDTEIRKRMDRAHATLVCINSRGGKGTEARLPFSEDQMREVLESLVWDKGNGMRKVGEKVLLACEMLERRERYAELREARRELEDAQREMRELDKERKELEDEVERKRKMLFLMGVLEKRERVRMERIGKGYAGMIGDLRKQVDEEMKEVERVVNGKMVGGKVGWDEEMVRKKMERMGKFERTRDTLAKLHAAHLRGETSVEVEGNERDIGENELEGLRRGVEEKEQQLSLRIERAAGLGWVCGEDMDWLSTFRTETAPGLDGMLSAERERVSGYVGQLSAGIGEKKRLVSSVREMVGAGGVGEVEKMLEGLELSGLRTVAAVGEVDDGGVVMSSSVERNRLLLTRKQAKIAYGTSLAGSVRTMVEDSRVLLR